MRPKLFLHGVPDTPALWEPALSHLNLPKGIAHTPALPGFGVPVPQGFTCTKDAYAEWVLDIAKGLNEVSGPIDIVGHDWGALLTARAVSLRSDLFATWTISNAAPHVDYEWHSLARIWQTPVLGELFQMLVMSPKALAKSLKVQGLPSEMARKEAAAFGPVMKRAIRKLYRSAKSVGTEWDADIDNIHSRGLVFWGEQDPYVPLWVGQAFADRTGASLKTYADAAHWSIVQKSEDLAIELKALWAEP